MTKDEIAKKMWEQGDVPRHKIIRLADMILMIMKETLQAREDVKIASFGIFEVRTRKERMGRNPKTKEPAIIPEGQTVRFRPGKPMKKRVRLGAVEDRAVEE